MGRVAITGVGVVANCGIGAAEFWDGLLRAEPAGDGAIPGFDYETHAKLTRRAGRRIDRFCAFALAAAEEAIAQAGGIEGGDPFRYGTLIGSANGGTSSMAAGFRDFWGEGFDAVSPHTIPMEMLNAAAGQISMRFLLRGPCETISTACASGTHAILRAGQLIADGRADVMVAGGAEAGLEPMALAAFTNMGALSPSGLSRPFDEARDGFVMSEGAAVVVLEDWDRAIKRGATILAEFLGGASTADAFHITAPDPEGTAARRALDDALADAGLEASDIGHVNAHGTSTPLNDRAEAAVIAAMFGNDVPVTSIKGVTGHSIGAAGAIEFVSVVLTMANETIPPTAGTVAVDPSIEVDIVHGEPRRWSPAPTVSNSFAFGGHNAVVVIGPPDPMGR